MAVMTTRSRDMFLDALASARSDASNMELTRQAARSIHKQAADLAAPPATPPAPPAAIAEPVPVTAPARPDYADDIDRIVRELVAAGDIVWDAALGAYRKQHCRRFRFSDK
jgi:hypothetical protein